MPKQENIIVHEKAKSNPILILLVLLLILISGTLGYLYNKERLTKSDDKIKEASIESEKVMSELSKIILIPNGDTPSIATIVDVEKLKKENAIFYADAQNGDNLVIFAKRAIIYRANDKKIINIAPIVPSDKKTDTNSSNITTDTKDSTKSTTDETKDSKEPEKDTKTEQQQ